ncbi:hypothetical protein [Micromonospora sp. NPDC049679]|uniref:hypothetical protein n=1 Tax=Micromonospora sp. NPDC049679 TaxID=3155920 RepID=UPI00340B3129
MDSAATVGAILRTINDQTVVRPYGDGLLVDLPLTYGDGDVVRILVEPMGSGFRVSDRAVAATQLAMTGVNVGAGRPAEAFAEAARSAGLSGVNAAPGELATFGVAEELGRMVLDVAQASMRTEQLRWLAVRQTLTRFPDRVVDRVKSWAQGSRHVQREAPLALRSGRKRQVTLRVSSHDRSAYIQAVSSRDRDQAAEHCYYIFDLSDVPKENRIAALDGARADWPTEIVSELAQVGDVEFFADPLSLERQLDKLVPPPRAALQR